MESAADVKEGLWHRIPWSETASELYRPSDRRLSRSYCQLLRIIMWNFAQSKNSESSREPLLGKGSVNTSVARQWLGSRHVIVATDTQEFFVSL
jgi:hypothetical protein